MLPDPRLRHPPPPPAPETFFRPGAWSGANSNRDLPACPLSALTPAGVAFFTGSQHTGSWKLAGRQAGREETVSSGCYVCTCLALIGMSPWERPGSQAALRQYLGENGDDKLAKCQVRPQCEKRSACITRRTLYLMMAVVSVSEFCILITKVAVVQVVTFKADAICLDLHPEILEKGLKLLVVAHLHGRCVKP